MAIAYGPARVTFVRLKTRIVTHSQGAAKTVAKPWRRSRQGCRGSAGRVGAGAPARSKGRSSSEDRPNETALTRKAAGDPMAATSAAPTAGPATRPRFRLRLVSELALGRSLSGTIWGTRAAKAG